MDKTHTELLVSLEIPSKQRRSELAKSVSTVFDSWDLAASEKLLLLGLSPSSRILISRFRNQEPLPASRDTCDRTTYLLAIAEHLSLSYMDKEQSRKWLRQRHPHLKNFTPLETMLEKGLVGIWNIFKMLEKQQTENHTEKYQSLCFSELGPEDLLPFFRRYRRACQQYAKSEWPEDTMLEWEGDREFLMNEYGKNRHTSFGFASDHAYERLFLRCCGK